MPAGTVSRDALGTRDDLAPRTEGERHHGEDVEDRQRHEREHGESRGVDPVRAQRRHTDEDGTDGGAACEHGDDAGRQCRSGRARPDGAGQPSRRRLDGRFGRRMRARRTP